MSTFVRRAVSVAAVVLFSAGWTACGAPPTTPNVGECRACNDVSAAHAHLPLCTPPTSQGCQSPSQSFSGTWTGDVVAEDVASRYRAAVGVTVDGQTLAVASICPDGSGAFTAFGSGDSASWTGATPTECTVPGSECPQRIVRYVGGTVDLVGGRLVMHLSAECGDKVFTATFDGSPPALR